MIVVPEPIRDDDAMREALRLARRAAAMGNVPVGAVVVAEGRIVGRGANLTDTLQDPTAHAEVLALREAARTLGAWRLEGATLFVTLEPCAMCAGAALTARVARVVYGAVEPKTGAVVSTVKVLTGPRPDVEQGLRETECRELLTSFFEDLRVQRRPR